VRIAYVIDKMVRAGAQRHLAQVIRGIGDRGHQPILCCLLYAGPLGEELEKAGVPVSVLGLKGVVGRDFFRAVSALRRLCVSEDIDIIHAYLFAANIVAPWAGLFSGRRVITSRRDDGFWKRPRHIIAHRLGNVFTSRVTANSRSVVEYLRLREHLPGKRISLIYNGIDPRPPSAPRPARKTVRIGCLGNIRPVKGYEDMVKALARLDPGLSWEAHIAGRDLERDHALFLKNLVRETGLEKRVVWTGEIDEPYAFLESLDIFVLPSRSEGFSNSLLEAMSCACPVVATAVGANDEVIRAGRDGIVVPPADPAALARELEKLVVSATRRESWGRSARLRAREFSTRKMLGQMDALYREVGGGR